MNLFLNFLTSVGPGGAGPQLCGVADPSRRGGVMLPPPPRHENIRYEGRAWDTARRHLGPICWWSDGLSPSPPLMDPNYGGRKRALSARLRRPVRLLRIGRSVVRSLSLSAGLLLRHDVLAEGDHCVPRPATPDHLAKNGRQRQVAS